MAANSNTQRATEQEKRNTIHGVYRDLEDIPFPVDDARNAFGGGACSGSLGHFTMLLASSLKVPYGAVVLGMLSLAAFMAHRTVAQYTPMLGVPPLPWLSWIGNSGDGKSKLIWWLKQVIKECEKRATKRAWRKFKQETKLKKEELPPPAERQEAEMPESDDGSNMEVSLG